MSIIIGVILAAAFLMVVMKWWSEGIFEASEAFVLAVIFCSLIFGLCTAQTVPQFLLAFIPLASAGGYAYYSYHIGSTRSYYKRRCQDFMAAIQADPRNLSARESLADAHYGLGDLDRAIDEIQAAVDIGAGQECNYKLKKWSKERHLRDTLNPVCRWCNTENAQGLRKCSHCGSDLPYDNALSLWLIGGRTSRARYYFLVIIGLALISVSLLLLPLKFAFIPFLLCIVAIAGWSLLSSSRK